MNWINQEKIWGSLRSIAFISFSLHLFLSGLTIGFPEFFSSFARLTSFLKQWIRTSSESSSARFKAKLERLSGIISFHTSRIQFTAVRRGEDINLPAEVGWLIASSASHLSYFCLAITLKGLFQLTSGVCIHLLDPPVTIETSLFFEWSNFISYLLYDIHRSPIRDNDDENESAPRTLFTQVWVNSVLIKAFEDKPVKQLFNYLSKFGVISLKTMKGVNFMSSAIAARQTETQVFSCPVALTVTVFHLNLPLMLLKPYLLKQKFCP